MQEKKSLKNLKIKKLCIVGVIPSFAFQRAKYCALELHRKLPQRFPLPEIVGLLELDWSEKLQEWRQTLGREYWCLRRPVAVFFDDRFIGSDIELIKLMTIGNILMENIPRKNMSCIQKDFRKDYIAYLRKTKRIYCYLDICIDGVYAGTLTFQLYSDLLPRTCENFKILCLGSRGPLLSYRGSRIHRIVKKGWLQGGDLQYKTGGGGFSIFCDPLEDECFGISHDRRGVLSMASGGRHSNGSQFFVTFQPSKWMDGNFVAFGRLVEGAKLLKTLENLDTFYECPVKKVEIKSCGELDLEDVEDVTYKEEPIPIKKPKRIETISEQVVRLIMEALTDALVRKERKPDILDDGDVPSKMNLQLYFQGFYSLPQSIFEETATYLRNLRREFLRVIKPNATEIVEVIMYDLLMAVLTRMTTLDDVRETIGHDLYQKMISGIDMKIELCQKSYVRRLVDQIVSTAGSMVNLVSKKILKMKRTSVNLKKFQERMQSWVQSFVLQEVFEGDNYFIAEREQQKGIAERKVASPEQPEEKQHPKREGIPCCEAERKKKAEELKAKLMAKYGPQDLCCLGSKLHLSDSVINLYDYFSICRYNLKKIPKVEDKERMPLLDLIEISRFKLKWIRKEENKVRDKEMLCIDKKVRKWMSEVCYTPETSWLRDAVFPKECRVLDHLEEIMYGAMTAGLLEMYYFMEQYMKVCGGKKQRLVKRTIYPEESLTQVQIPPPETSSRFTSEIQPQEEHFGEVEEEAEKGDDAAPEESKQEETRQPCTCGHPCCVCPFDPNYKSPPPPPPSLEGETEGEEEGEAEEEKGEVEEEPTHPVQTPEEVRPCASDETLVDLNAMIADKVSLTPEEIDIGSFKWLKPYILEKGCDLKTEFATQVHKWLDGERFSCKGFISKHSLVTTASLLSLSMSLAELIKEENNLKPDIKNFIYDLWDLYFEEMFKEALLKKPPEDIEEEGGGKVGKGAEEGEREGERQGEGEKEEEGVQYPEECAKIIAQTPDFDFDKFCEKFGDVSKIIYEKTEEEVAEQLEQEEYEPEPPKEPEPEPKEVPEQTEKVPEPPKPTEESVEELAESETSFDKPIKEVAGGDAGDDVGDDAGNDAGVPDTKPPEKKKSPIVIEELVDEPSEEEIRHMPPYVLPFWVKFLTELTKQALGAIAKVSRLPRRLYFQSESELAFDEKMKDWFEFNAFNPQPTKGREIMEYIALHHKTLDNLEDTARSYLKKKKYSELINRCTRFTSAEEMADEIVADVIDTAMEKTENETLELFVSNVLSSAITSSPMRSQASFEEGEEDEFKTLYTDQRDSDDLSKEEED